MAWVRIDDGAMTHPKILTLSDSAFRLWIKGLIYCQKHLTDGLIPRAALPELKPRRQDIDALTTPIDASYAPLWETIDGFGFKVHDYVFWNDSREKVRDRQVKARARKEQWKAAKNGVPNSVPERVPIIVPNTSLTKPNLTKPNLIREREERAPLSGDLDNRAAAFIERYPAIYAKARSGAGFRVSEARDFPAFIDLVSREPVDARLDELFSLFLHLKPARDVLNVPGTPRQFVHMFPECDRLLRENGR